MTDLTNDTQEFEQNDADFEKTAIDFLDARIKMIDELKLLSLEDFVRLLRKKDDPIAELASSAGVYGEIAAVHFPGENPAGAFNFLFSMALRHVPDDELDTEAAKARAWVLNEWGQVYGLEAASE